MDFIKTVAEKLEKNSSTILTGIGIGAGIATVISAVAATPKAMRIIEAEKEEKGELSKKEIFKVTWKCYIPAAVTGAISIGCIVASKASDTRRAAAFATAYTIADTARQELQDKTLATVGEKKFEEIKSAIAGDKMEKDPVSKKEVIITPKGNVLCYDELSGRYFRSDIEHVRSVINNLNKILIEQGFLSLNEFYFQVGLPEIKIGEDLGWDATKGLIDPNFESKIADDGTPCLVIQFRVEPRFNVW